MSAKRTVKRIPITDVRPGHEVWDAFGPVGIVTKAWRAGRYGVIAYTTRGTSIVRHLSPFASNAKLAGTVTVTA